MRLDLTHISGPSAPTVQPELAHICSQDSRPKPTVLRPHQRTYGGWDADAVGVHRGCTLYFYQYSTRTWHTFLGGMYDSEHRLTWYKVSWDSTIKASC